MPLPKEDTTPPVTNTYLVMSFGLGRAAGQRDFGLVVKRDYIDRPLQPCGSDGRPAVAIIEGNWPSWSGRCAGRGSQTIFSLGWAILRIGS
jgi:hypothetical protein